MRKLLLFLFAFLISVNAYATTCTIPYESELTGGFIFAAHWNENFQAISTCLNNQTLDGTTNIAIGGIQTSNIANLAVTDAKIFGITTAGKVNGSSITAINNLPSGAGIVPIANLPTGNTANTLAFYNSGGNVGIGTFSVTGMVAAASFTGQSGAGLFKTPISESVGTKYGPALSDGIVIATCSTGGSQILQLSGYSNTNSTPTSGSDLCNILGGGASSGSAITCPLVVLKGYYYELTTSSNCSGAIVTFTPLGS